MAFETNVFGVVRVTQAALPLLRRSANPVIVNVASGLGFPRCATGPGTTSLRRTHGPVRQLEGGRDHADRAVREEPARACGSTPSDPGYTATDLNQHSGHQTVTEGTDATVALATLGPDGPTGEYHNRQGHITY